MDNFVSVTFWLRKLSLDILQTLLAMIWLKHRKFSAQQKEASLFRIPTDNVGTLVYWSELEHEYQKVIYFDTISFNV